MIAASVVGISVVADPPKRCSWVVLGRLGPVGQPVDVVPGPAGTWLQVDSQAQWMLTISCVAGRRVTRGHDHVVPSHQVLDVGRDSLVDELARGAGDRNEPSAARDAANSGRGAGRRARGAGKRVGGRVRIYG